MEINGISDIAVSAGVDIQAFPAYAVQQPKKEAPAAITQSKEAEHPEDIEQMQKAVEDIQKNLNNLDVSLQFSTYGKHNNQVSIVVMEKESGKVIREIPSRELKALSAAMSELVGLIFNKKV